MLSSSALFESFVSASTFRTIQNAFHQLCLALDIEPSDSINVYRKLRLLDYWKAQKLWKLLDKKWELAEYKNQAAGDLLNVFIIGAGPCGLRSAIECALLGCRVVLVEQRDRFSRNNVLHLWEFVIQDLKLLGAKIFYPKFCTGSIEHISIRQLQCILLKVALCFGVQIYDSLPFIEILFPTKVNDYVTGFRPRLEPSGHILSEYDIDVIIGADGKRNTLPGFPREEMRGKLAIGITANFVNNRTAAEERVPEISGVAYIFNQAFFKDMYAKVGVDLENIVYYKDDTHYFVMCAKKHSLLEMGVIRKDYDDISQLLSFQNVDNEALCRFARAAANFATNGKLPLLEFARNNHGNEDIAMFDFTSLYSSKCSVRLVERLNKYLLMGIVGDSLHEPFWPTGSGCARGFLGVLDTAWLIREYGLNKRGPLEIIAERECIYRLLAQVTKDNMSKMINKYTIDPRTRYVSLDISFQPEDFVQIISSDNPRLAPIGQPLSMNNTYSVHKNPNLRMYSLWKFCYHVLLSYKLKIFDMDFCWRDGRSLAGLVAKFFPESLDYFQVLDLGDIEDRIQIIFNAVEGVGIAAPCKPCEWVTLKVVDKVNYVEKLVKLIKCEKSRLEFALVPWVRSVQKRRCRELVSSNPKKSEPIRKLTDNLLSCSTFMGDRDASSVHDSDSKTAKSNELLTKKDLSVHSCGRCCNPDVTLSLLGSSSKSSAPVPPPKAMSILREHSSVATKPIAPIQPERHVPAHVISTLYDSVNVKRQEICRLCEKVVYLAERVQLESMFLHKNCFRCAYCSQPLRLGEYGKDKDLDYHYPERLFCRTHLRVPLKDKIARIERSLRISEKFVSRNQELPIQTGNEIKGSDDVVSLRDSLSQCSATLSFFSPEQLRNRTVQRIRDCGITSPVSPVSDLTQVVQRTPERAEFSSHARESSTRECVNASDSESDLEEEIEGCIAPSNEISTNPSVEVVEAKENESATEDEDNDLEEEDLDELEKTVLRFTDENPELPFTDNQVVTVIENINRRRDAQLVNNDYLVNRNPNQSSKDVSSLTKTLGDADLKEFTADIVCASDILSGNMPEEASSALPESFTARDMRKKKSADLEQLRNLCRLKARLKTDEELGLGTSGKAKSISSAELSTAMSSHATSLEGDLKVGSTEEIMEEEKEICSEKQLPMSARLLSRLYCTESTKISPILLPSCQPMETSFIHSESRKETNILGNALWRIRTKREENHSKGTEAAASLRNEVDYPEVPCAAVAPSPRVDTGKMNCPIMVNERNIKLFHKRAEKIRRRHDEERRRGAQEIQRGLDECEIRLEEIGVIGHSLELKLAEDPKNGRMLDSWLALVHERELLMSKQEMLRLSKREVELELKYRDLNIRFKQLGEGMNDNLAANSELLAAMLSVVEERKQVNKLIENAKQSCKRANMILKSLKERGRDFQNFVPVFS